MSEHEMDVLVRRLADEMESRRNGSNRLAEKLRLNIGTVLVVVGTIASATFYGTIQLQDIKYSLGKAGEDRWRGRHMKEWSYRLQYKNPSVVVPDPNDVTRELP